jgi:hypothetical protein
LGTFFFKHEQLEHAAPSKESQTETIKAKKIAFSRAVG